MSIFLDIKKYWNNEKLINRINGVESFKRLNLNPPKENNVIDIGDPNVEEEISYYSLTIFTSEALKKKGYEFEYNDYIKLVFKL